MSLDFILEHCSHRHEHPDELRPVAPEYLARVIELILNLLVSHSLSPKSASVETLLTILADEHEVGRSISEQIMGWFGTIAHGKWTVNVDAIVREVGLAILRLHRVSCGPLATFLGVMCSCSVARAYHKRRSLRQMEGISRRCV